MHQGTCSITGETFYIPEREVAHCARLGIPLPTTSPLERMRTLMAFRNEWKLYRRKCDATGADIISAYPPDSHFTVYNNAYWWGDTWDALEYGRDFDFLRGFFEQFAELQRAVPREGTTIFNSENCDYNSHIRQSKNCYLNSLVAKCEDTSYSYWMVNDKDCYDCIYTNDSTLCYFTSDVNNCYQCVMLAESNNCTDCHFSYQLKGCHNCLFSSNLVNKSYYIYNKPVTRAEFEETKKSLLNGSYTTWQHNVAEFKKLRHESVHQNIHSVNVENSTGDHLFNSRNCDYCFDAHGSEDCYNAVSLADSRDVVNSYSAGWPACELVYMSNVSRGCTDIAFCTYSWFSQNLRYCDSMNSCSDCFGCIGLRRKKYCIFNRQYTKEEYEVLVPRLVEHMKERGEWGQFFPRSLSPFAYNESAAMDFFALTKEEILERGWNWREASASEYQNATLAIIPDTIVDVPDSITKEILKCDGCGKNYRIIPAELRFYRSMNMPIPRQCSTCRHAQKMQARNLPFLWERTCRKCTAPIYSSFDPTSKETVYCQECYSEVYFS